MRSSTGGCVLNRLFKARLVLVERVGEVEVRRGLVRCLERVRVGGDLLERAGQGVRVAAEKRARGVGQVLALPRDRELDELRRDGREDGEDDRHDDEDELQRCRRCPCCCLRLPAAEPRPAHEEVGQQRDQPHEHDGDRHDADVVVADVRHLVRDHAFELGLVELVEQAARGGDGRVLGVAAGSEGVRRAVFDDVDLRHRQAGADAEVLDDAVELRLLLLRHLHARRSPPARRWS